MIQLSKHVTSATQVICLTILTRLNVLIPSQSECISSSDLTLILDWWKDNILFLAHFSEKIQF